MESLKRYLVGTRRNKNRKRTALRLKYPVICAVNFKMVLNVIIQEILGWN
jgi:hypothetical protein